MTINNPIKQELDHRRLARLVNLRWIKDRTLKHANAYTFIWAVMFITQNTYFGWNRTPQSTLEFWTDLAHVIPAILALCAWHKATVIRTLIQVEE